MIEHHESRIGNDTRIHWVSTGAGDEPPFILVHGWGSSVVKWMEVMPQLGALRRTIAIDLPGFGQSSTPRGSYSPGWLAGAIKAFMDEAGIDKAVLVGNSLGGLVSIHAATAWPERVEALIAAAPALPNDGPQPPVRNIAAMAVPILPVLGPAMLARYGRRDPALIVQESLARNCVDPSRVSQSMRDALIEETRLRPARPEQVRSVTLANRRMMWALSGGREMTWRVVRALKPPTLFLWGSGDRLVPAHIGQRAVAEVPGSQLVVLDDIGHNPHIEAPEDFSAAVISFTRAAAARAPQS